MTSKISHKIKKRDNANDVFITPLGLAKIHIDLHDIKEGEVWLDPCKNDGSYYNQFPNNVKKDYCEILENKDFLEYDKKVDCIIGNPPYSLWNKWIEKTCELTDKFCYIMSCYNLTPPRLNQINKLGYGITYFKLLKINWWFSPSFIVIFEKNKKSIIDFEPNAILCDLCNKRCHRGRTHKEKKYGMNECSNV